MGVLFGGQLRKFGYPRSLECAIDYHGATLPRRRCHHRIRCHSLVVFGCRQQVPGNQPSSSQPLGYLRRYSTCSLDSQTVFLLKSCSFPCVTRFVCDCWNCFGCLLAAILPIVEPPRHRRRLRAIRMVFDYRDHWRGGDDGLDRCSLESRFA
jgi:hypothetical protein